MLNALASSALNVGRAIAYPDRSHVSKAMFVTVATLLAPFLILIVGLLGTPAGGSLPAWTTTLLAFDLCLAFIAAILTSIMFFRWK